VGLAEGLAEEPLTKGVVGYASLDGHLDVTSPEGDELLADFSRHSQAFTDDLRPVDENQPRWAPGKFGQGVMVEPGCETAQRIAFRNYLAPGAAQIEGMTDGSGPYEPVGGASVKIIEGRAGTHIGTDHAVLEGTRCLAVQCVGAGSGVQSRQGASIMPAPYTLSLFARSEGPAQKDEKIRLELAGTDGKPIGSSDVPISAVWTRVQASFAVGKFTRDKSKQTRRDVHVRVLAARAGQAFRIDGVVLELNGGYSYAGTRRASSWLPGHGYRTSELLAMDALRYRLRGQTGSAAFWANLRGQRQGWRTLFEIADRNRWQPRLQLKFRPNGRLWLGPRKEKPTDVVAAVKVEPGAWHHYVVTWAAATATMYLDGKPVGRIEGIDIPERLLHIRLGCAGPNAAANAVMDEAVFYDRPLAAAEVAELAQREEALSAVLGPEVGIRPARFIETIAHTRSPQAWLCDLVSHGAKDVADVTVTLRIGDALRIAKRVPTVEAGGAVRVAFRFVADLALGWYPFAVTAESGGRTLARIERRVEITPTPEPFENLQVAPWGWNAEREWGLTFGGGDLEDAMRKGLWYSPMWHYLGYPRHMDGEDWVHGMDDKPFRASLTSPYLAAQIEREGQRLARRFEAIPATRGVTLSSEMQWLWQHDFSPDRIAWVRKTFGVDLNTWRYPPKKGGVNAFQTPFGRLKPSVAKLALPPDRVIPVDHGFYAYHRWFHGPSGPTEAYLNQHLSDHIHQRRADILTIQEPILRRAAVRAFDRVSIGQEWFYYEDPMRTVMIQERLNAAVRGTPLRPTGMPQFLFKAGAHGAAPYNSIATGDMYRQTVWLCAMQPIRMFTYWNLQVVPRADFENYYSRCMTKAQIDELFGTPTPTREQVKQVLKDKPTVARKLMPWTPGLFAGLKRFHLEEVGPLGAVIPHWRNRPRRIAVLRSFASQIWREVRWPRTSWLERCAVYGGVPFDVLYDSDFETDTDPLASYRLVIVSRAVCLTRPTYEWLVKFAQRGGTIVVDKDTLVKLPGAVVLEPTDRFEMHRDDQEQREKELLARFGTVGHPQYVEAMTAWAADQPNPVEPAFRALLDTKVDAEGRTLTPNTWLNLLEAEGANYVGVVNTLRIRGPMYGHFGRVREKGVPQTAAVTFDPSLGAVAYDLLSHERLTLARRGDRSELRLALPGDGARLLVLLPQAIATLSATAEVVPTTWGDHAGREAHITASLADTDGSPVPGLVPATVTIVRPDGSRSDYSCHAAFHRGRLTCRLPVASNAPPGRWRVSVLERASGQEADATFRP